MIPPGLEEAYRRTTYRIGLPTGEIGLRVGEASPPIDRWLAAAGSDAWAVVTACNPGSLPLSGAENARRQAALRRAVEERGLDMLPACNVADGIAGDGKWPDEPSCFIHGPEAVIAAALELGRRFGQVAILAGRRNELPRLVSCLD